MKPFFNGTLTFLYRVLFLLYAESRNLLPVYERDSYYLNSLKKLKEEVAEAADVNRAQSANNIALNYTETSFKLYKRLRTLFQAIDRGDAELNVPTYNGGLFVTESSLKSPARSLPEWEQVVAQLKPDELESYLLANYMISDRHLAQGLDKLARGLDLKDDKLVFIDYKSLGVRQLGSIYEGLLEFKLRYAVEEMVIVKGKIIPLSQAGNQYKKGKTPTIQEHHVYIENDRHERKATGSYYTPDYIVKYIVEQTVGPIMDEKEKLLLPQFRRVQKDLMHVQRENSKPSGFKHRGMDLQPFEPIYIKYASLVDNFFDLKVLDPAMGSGHFLVDAVDYITRRMIKFLDKLPRNPVWHELQQIRTSIAESMEKQHIALDSTKLTDINLLKRQILKRCIYGVDLNRMAVELAKVSVWLDSFTLGAPLSFLDHHMKWGNSLLGIRISEVQEKMTYRILSNRYDDLLNGTTMMIKLSKRSDSTVNEVHESQEFYEVATEKLYIYKKLTDLWLSEYFGNKGAQSTASIYTGEILDRQDAALDKIDRDAIALATRIADKDQKNFFHWDLEFPEVFFDEQGTKPNGADGFDAVVGNPPYVRQEGLGNDKVAFKTLYKVFNSIADLYTYFIERGNSMLRYGGRFGMITANKFTRTNYGSGVRLYLIEQVKLEKLIDFGDLPVFGDATTYPIIIITQERLLGLVESLSLKIAAIDRNGLLDTSVLGEVVHPQNFNMLKRIEEEDGSVIEEQEQFAELVSSEFLLQNLKDLLGQGIRQDLEALPDGIHSGLARSGARGIFFYFTTREKKRRSATKNDSSQPDSKRQHFWRYIDLTASVNSGIIEENRYLITNLIQATPETPRIMLLSGEVNVFELQEKVIASILHTAATQVALEEAPKRLDPIQQTVGAILKSYYNHPAVQRQDLLTAMQRVNVPQPRVYVKTLKKAFDTYKKTANFQDLLAVVNSIGEQADTQAAELPKTAIIKRDDLKLVCFEYLW